MKKSIVDIFFHVLRYSIGASNVFPSGISEGMWYEIFKIAQQQSLLGVLFYGIQKQDQEKPPREMVLKWYAISEQIRQANEKTNRVAVDLADFFRREGFRTCVLKGQGNALYYPDPSIRMSGDIDIWVKPVKGLEFRDKSGGVGFESFLSSVLLYVRKKNPKAKACYHHVDAGEYKGVEVEVHYRPSFMNNLIHNRRLQKWFEVNAEDQFSHEVELPNGAGQICVPTNAFNHIYQMAHIYNHVIHEGVGLRQIVDYYYLLRKAKDESEKLIVKSEKFFDENSGQKSGNLNAGHVGSDGLELSETLRYLGLEKFAGAVMWVLHEALGLEDKYMIVQPNEKLGKFLLDEIMQGGNFGQYEADGSKKKPEGRVAHNLHRLQRDLRLMWYFPSECLWEPVFRVYHFFWRLVH